MQSEGPVWRVDERALEILRSLLAGVRVCTLATHDEKGPYAAMVAYAVEAGLGTVLVHLSDLAEHKRHLDADPRVAVLIARPDDGHTEVLMLPRLLLRCRAVLVPRDGEAYSAARHTYLARHPRHAMTFGLADFDVYRLAPESGLLNAGFGRAYLVTPADVLAASTPEPPAA